MGGRGRLLLVLWIAWACVVLSFYYAYVPRAVFSPTESLAFDAPAAAVALLLLGAGTWMWRRVEAWRGLVAALGRRFHAGADRRAFAAMLVTAGLVTLPWWLASGRVRLLLTRVTAPHFPFVGEAAARIVSGLLGASLVGLAAVGAGTLVLRALRWRTSSRGEYLVFAAASGFLAISFISFLLAAAGAYRPLAVAATIAAACLIGALVTPPVIRVEQLQPRRRQAVSAAPWLALTTVALAFAAVAALAPEKEYDALWYHLNLPRLWLESGRPVDIIEEYVSLYPLTWELIFGAGMVLGGVVGAKLLHVLCLPLLGAVVWLAARRYVCCAPAVAAAVVVTTPTLLWDASTAYVDVALAFHAAAACYALARYAERGELPWGAMAALQCGAAAATKHLGVVVTLVALAVYVIAMVRAGRAVGTTARRALIIGLAAALVPMPWYLRSWMASGNPVFPELFSVFGAFPPERWDELTERGLAGFKARFGFGRSFVDLLSLPWDVTVHGARFGGSLGPLFLLLLPAAPFVGRSRAVLAIAAGVAAYAAIWASPISSYQMRFLMPVVAPMALLAAAGLEGIGAAASQWPARGRQLVIAVVFGVAVMNLPPFTRLHERDREGWTGYLTHVLREAPVAVLVGRESEASYLRREVASFAAWQHINARLPDDARVLTFVGGDQLYARRQRISYDSTMARPAVAVSSEDIGAAVGALRGLGITHVLFDRRELARLHGDALAIGSPALQRACTIEYDDRRFWVCRLDYSRLPPGRAE